MKKGFTIIELMVFVVIIGILAAIAVPKFHELCAKEDQRKAAEAATARAASDAADMSRWKLLKGKVVQVMSTSDGQHTAWNIVLTMENGTSVTIQTGQPAADETVVCARYNPDRTHQDTLVICE